MQRLPAITHTRFGLFRFRSPLLTESQLFSLPVGTEMFHFPTFPPTALCVQAEVAGHYSGFFRGFPIRRSTDQSSFTSSPWLIAGYNVLHRLLMPRHPPTALSSLSPNKTINKIYKDARVHYTILKQQTNTRTPTPHGSKHPGTVDCDTHHTHGGSPRTQQRATAQPQPRTRAPSTPPTTGGSTKHPNPNQDPTRSMPSTKSHPSHPHHTRA